MVAGSLLPTVYLPTPQRIPSPSFFVSFGVPDHYRSRTLGALAVPMTRLLSTDHPWDKQPNQVSLLYEPSEKHQCRGPLGQGRSRETLPARGRRAQVACRPLAYSEDILEALSLAALLSSRLSSIEVGVAADGAPVSCQDRL
jgi:hypothetical protein